MQQMRSRLNQGAWALVILVLIEILTNFVSKELTVGTLVPESVNVPREMVYSIWFTLVIITFSLTLLLWVLNQLPSLRLAIFLMNGMFTLQLFAEAVLIVVRLVQNVRVSVSTLIVDAIILFITNILVFALWYWFMETGNSRMGQPVAGPAWDFLFPQRQGAFPGYETWKPHFMDYIFLAYTTSVAFSPTDTLPLSRTAKGLMMVQASISLITIVVVAGTAINILASNA